MICGEVRERLSLYLDDRLSAGELARVRTHLGGCSACSAEREALDQVDGLLEAALGDHPFGDAAVEQVLAGLPMHQLRRRAPATPAPITRFPRSLGVALTAAAAALLGALTLSLLQQEQAPRQPATAKVESAVLGQAGSGLMRLSEAGEVLDLDAPLRSGDRLLAVKDLASLNLQDGTVVELHADTEVELRRDDDGGVTVELRGSEGRVFCEVAKRRRPFRVKARGLGVQVLGTRFLVEQRRLVSSVVVVEGRVLATTAGDRRELGADDKAEVAVGQDKLLLSQVTSRRHVEWVPRVREEQQELDAERVRKAEQSRPAKPVRPKQVKPVEPTHQPGMDQPVPPPGTNKRQGLVPPSDW